MVRLIALAGTALWSVALVVLAWVLPIGSGSSSGVFDGSGHQLSAATTSEVHVPLLVALVPLAMVFTTWLLLTSSTRWTKIIAWSIAGFTVLVSLLGMLTIGPVILPLALGLCVACATEGEATAARESGALS